MCTGSEWKLRRVAGRNFRRLGVGLLVTGFELKIQGRGDVSLIVAEIQLLLPVRQIRQACFLD